VSGVALAAVRCVSAAILLAILALPARATAEPVSQYVPRHRNERCRKQYSRWVDRHGRYATVRCVFQPPPYRGPWDSAHEPPALSAPGVTVSFKPGSLGYAYLKVSVAERLWCPGGRFRPITVTFSYPHGLLRFVTESIKSCKVAIWTESGVAGGPFLIGGRVQLPTPIVLEPTVRGEAAEPATPLPILVKVSGPSGILADAAFTLTSVVSEGEPEVFKNHDITECQRKHLDVFVENGEVFCKELLEGSKGTVYRLSDGW
jgi:hypothetical protein